MRTRLTLALRQLFSRVPVYWDGRYLAHHLLCGDEKQAYTTYTCASRFGLNNYDAISSWRRGSRQLSSFSALGSHAEAFVLHHGGAPPGHARARVSTEDQSDVTYQASAAPCTLASLAAKNCPAGAALRTTAAPEASAPGTGRPSCASTTSTAACTTPLRSRRIACGCSFYHRWRAAI